jgi:putative intracellular protease/amidase
MEVFAYAGYKVFVVSKTKEPIVSQGIMTIIPDYSINDAPEADILAFLVEMRNQLSKMLKL